MDQPKPFWTTWKKVVFTILLAVIVSYLFGCSSPHHDKMFSFPVYPETSNGDTDAAYLQRLYATYNEQYFDNKLAKVVKINVEGSGRTMADTQCDNVDGTECTISFNLHYTAAPRTAQSVLLHEMCHIKVWKSHVYMGDFPPDAGSEFYHDKEWRGCMLGLDSMGAFRVIEIDYYQGN